MARSRNSPKISVPLRTKISLVIFGVSVFLILLETGLRLGGFIILSLQEYRNQQSMRHKGTYRIMCLGESTTAGQYPSFLEEILNKRSVGIQFSVIDKGIGGTRSSIILAGLDLNINQYHPDMVVTMMGINDWGFCLPYEETFASSIGIFLKPFRVYKLTRILWLHIITKAGEEIWPQTLKGEHTVQTAPIPAEGPFKKVVEPGSLNEHAYIRLATLYRDQGKLSQAEDPFKKAIELNPKNTDAYLKLGWLYQSQEKFSQAESAFKEAIKLRPQSDGAYVGLGWSYHIQNKPSQAEGAFKKAIELNPKNTDAYLKLGWLYKSQKNLLQSEASFRKAAELDLQTSCSHLQLGIFYRTIGNFPQAEASFKKAIALNPSDDAVYLELGTFYRTQGKLPQAEEAFKKAVALNPQNNRAYGMLTSLYEEMGKPELAQECGKNTRELKAGYYAPLTIDNYHKLKEVISGKGIRLVCVQYPLRNIEPLKKIFKDRAEGIIFVDNEQIFKKAVKAAGYSVYFIDMFGGDFGHCTDKGNKLLAENIANVILKEVFHK
ncbi:MAG TPA: tetratricopeptide repeat protein [Patescibacteria group bacterium]|nr:tetratricopeptide repeat protein [Patescibacteria group bacterium]